MDRQKFAATYGAADEDYSKVLTALAPFGLTEVTRNPAARSLLLKGTVAQVEAAFQVKLFEYAHEQERFRGHTGAVSLPVAIADIVASVSGLDARRVGRRRRPPRGLAVQFVHSNVATNGLFTGATLATHYNFPPGNGTGQCVGILEFGGGYFPADLKHFCEVAGISVPKVLPISADGTRTNARDGAEGEVMLDVEVVAAACPAATIALYFAQFTEKGWITAFDAAVHDSQNKPSVVSVSWGWAEDDTQVWSAQAVQQLNETMKEAALLGVTICVAAGDDGSSDADMDGHAHVDFPASSPYALAVGGTTVVQAGTLPDVCWFEGDGLRSDNGGSTGGGVSVIFSIPDWQKQVVIAPVNQNAAPGRIIPDIAANADWNASPYLLVVDGNSQPNGGTSAAAPLLAALVARINAARAGKSPVGWLTPLLYKSSGGGTVGSQGCTDVTKGGNKTATVGGFTAGAGYDAVSGWGTPNGTALLAAINAASPA
jgi:kumamolisin